MFLKAQPVWCMLGYVQFISWVTKVMWQILLVVNKPVFGKGALTSISPRAATLFCDGVYVCVCVCSCFQEEENRLREELRQEWERKQEKIKGKWSENNDHIRIWMKWRQSNLYTIICGLLVSKAWGLVFFLVINFCLHLCKEDIVLYTVVS